MNLMKNSCRKYKKRVNYKLDVANKKNKNLLWFVNKIELPLINILLHKGDVHMYNQIEIAAWCKTAGLEFL